jgi:formylglycine-generating enzyme required for sulfatase activity
VCLSSQNGFQKSHKLPDQLKWDNFMLKQFIVSVLLGFICVSPVFANNLVLKGLDEVSSSDTTHSMTFTVSLKQDNAWKNTTSHDAVWVFMKYSTDAGQTWHHATMLGSGVNPAGMVLPSAFEAYVPQDGKGFFVRRKDVGAGNVEIKGLQFGWNYGQDGISDGVAKAANTITRVFGIEMVYIPQGAFFAGDGASSSEFRLKKGSSDDQPWYVNSENAVTTTNSASGAFYYQGTGSPGENSSGDSFIISNSFPKGFQGFYLMKYELTEGEWVEFFNTLPAAAKLKRDITSSVDGGKGAQAVVNRNTILWDASNPSSLASTQRPARAMTYLAWTDSAAFADWAALRPMTELEFEKAARGVDIQPVADEFAWGSSVYRATGAEALFPPNQDESGAEAIIDTTVNLNRNALGWTSGDGRIGGSAEGQKGALRAGIFAENSASRVDSGSGYYGNMELSGNVAEPAVTVGRLQGRQFLGSNGDGELNSLSGYEGNATNVDWPGIDGQDSRRGITGTLGIGYRGGDYQSGSVRNFQLSSRSFAAKDPDSEGFKRRFDSAAGIIYGARFARTAP